MNTYIRVAVTSSLLMLPAPLCASAGATVSPLPASDYTARPICKAPASGHAGCLALALVAKTAAARAHTHPLGITRSFPIRAASAGEGAFGLRPQDLHSIYQLPSTTPSPQTIAIVDAYNDLSAETDLEAYDEEFGLPNLPACAGGDVSNCFEKLNQDGETEHLPFPKTEAALKAKEVECTVGVNQKAREAACEAVAEAVGWAGEISLDIEVAHAVCHNCRIVLVETDSASFLDLETAEETAAGLGATEISNSWGGPEQGVTPAFDDAGAFNHPGIVLTASSGDNGYLDWDSEPGATKGFADYPASSPHVVAVGGTRLQVPLGPGGTWAGETVWNGNGAGGSGCSAVLASQPWQRSVSGWPSVGCENRRAVADVSADADPYTGVAVYNSLFECGYEEGHVIHVVHWCTIGGTSLASPLVASVFALGGGAREVAYPAATLYENEIQAPGSLHDVASGSNGECSEPFDEATGLSGCTELQEASVSCSETAICLARAGYDGPTGVGTPDGIAAFQPNSKEGESEHSSKGGGSGKGSSEGSGGDAGSGQPVPPSPTGAPPATGLPAAGSPHSSGVPTTVPILSAPALTKAATAALHRLRPRALRVAFAFTLNVAARIKIELAKQVTSHGARRWQILPDSLTIAGSKGRNRGQLRARGALAPGRYRLTLAPTLGSTRSLTFRVG